MKKLIVLAVLLFLASDASAEWVNGYWKDTNRNGVKDTYVSPYIRSAPDGNPYNNYTTQGNVNPYTGNRGTVNPAPTYNPYQYQPYQYRPVYPSVPDNRSGYR